MTRIGGIRYTIKDGITYDPKQFIEDARQMVEPQKWLKERAQ